MNSEISEIRLVRNGGWCSKPDTRSLSPEACISRLPRVPKHLLEVGDTDRSARSWIACSSNRRLSQSLITSACQWPEHLLIKLLGPMNHPGNAEFPIHMLHTGA